MARKRSAEISLLPRPVKGTAVFDAEKARRNNLLGTRLSEQRKTNNYTMEELTARLESYGISILANAVSKWENGISAPNAYQLLALCSIYNIEDPVGWFTGNSALNIEGLKKLADYRQDLIASGRYASDKEDNIIWLHMPVSYLAASAGTGNFLDEGNFEMLSFPASSVPHGAEFGIRVAGDSMEPVYTDGQIVWVQPCESLRPGEVGIFTLDGCGYIKRYGEQQPEDPEQFLDSTGTLHMQSVLISYNKKYDPIVIGPESRLEIVGRVLN